MGFRETVWEACGFSLPAGLEPTPPSLVSMQEPMLEEFAPNGNDVNFERPVELVWNRMIPALREPPWDEMIEKALFEIYRRRAFFSAYVRSFGSQTSRNGLAAMVYAAVLAGHTVIERARDLAARIADEFFLGNTPYPADRVHKWGDATTKLKRLIDASEFSHGNLDDRQKQAVKIAATQLASDLFGPIGEETGGVPTLADAEALRHVIAHGKDAIPEFATFETVMSYAHLMTYYFGWALWIPFGRAAGGATPEWSAAWRRKVR